jgi:hypothetical protein
MTIYVDDIQQYPSGQWCHMTTDGAIEELHAVAKRIGMKRTWFQDHPRHPHYDLRTSKRLVVLRLGAVAVSSIELLRRCSLPALPAGGGDDE